MSKDMSKDMNKNNQVKQTEDKSKLIRRISREQFYKELEQEELEGGQTQPKPQTQPQTAYRYPMLIGLEFDAQIFSNHTGEPVKTSNRKNEFDSEITVHVSANQIKDGLINGITVTKGKELSGVQKCVAFTVLLVIASHMDIEGNSFPSMGRIAELTGLSLRTVFTTIQNLEKVEIAGKPVMTIQRAEKKANVYQIEQSIFKE